MGCYCRLRSAACRRNRATWFLSVFRFGMLFVVEISRSHLRARPNFTSISFAFDVALFTVLSPTRVHRGHRQWGTDAAKSLHYSTSTELANEGQSLVELGFLDNNGIFPYT